jgi:sialidase-1
MRRLSAVLVFLMAMAVRAAEPQDVFVGQTGGYELYRIPGLVVTGKGTLLAYCEARKSAKSDWGTSDVLLRRSTDAGKTWSAPLVLAQVPGPHQKNPVALAQKLGQPTEVTYHNPVLIVESKTNVVHGLFCLEYQRCFYIRSTDDGHTFSAPVEITRTFAQFQPDYAWKVLATGPGHGIALGTGRLVVPVWLSTGTGGHAHRPSIVASIYSDDHGQTWERGAIVATNTDPIVNPNETAAAEFADGRVLFNIRTESKEHRRVVSISPNGATEWSKPTFAADLLEPICQASLLRVGDALLYCGCDNLDMAKGKAEPGKGRSRVRLTVKVSRDLGQTWPTQRVIDPGPAGYSDLAVAPDGTLYCLYERGSNDPKNMYAIRQLTLVTIERAGLLAPAK